jgi:hypothetical protein
MAMYLGLTPLVDLLRLIVDVIGRQHAIGNEIRIRHFGSIESESCLLEVVQTEKWEEVGVRELQPNKCFSAKVLSNVNSRRSAVKIWIEPSVTRRCQIPRIPSSL